MRQIGSSSCIGLAITALVVFAMLTTCGLFGPTPEEIHEGAVLVMKALADATASLSGGTDPVPAGVTIDDSGFSYEAGAGTIEVTLVGYAATATDVTLDGAFTIEMEWLTGPDRVVLGSTGTVTLSGAAVEECVFDTLVTASIDGAVVWSTAEWSGSITVDGQEADLDAVMEEYIAYLDQP